MMPFFLNVSMNIQPLHFTLSFLNTNHVKHPFNFGFGFIYFKSSVHPSIKLGCFASVLSSQNGLMVKVTETCPELNCTVSEQILPDGRCCNVCTGMSLCLTHYPQLHESVFLWTGTHQSPATARSKQSQPAGF